MKNTDITELDITLENNKYTFRIHGSATVEIKWNKEIDKETQDTLEGIYKNIVEEVRKINSEPDKNTDNITPFKKLGKNLYKLVIPTKKEFRNTLASIKTPLLISTDDPGSLWELFYIGDDFIATKYAVSRRFLAEPDSDISPQKDVSFGDKVVRRCLIIANSYGDLPQTYKELENITTCLKRANIPCDFLAGGRVTKENVLKGLSNPEYDIIHYSGHIYCDSPKDKTAFIKLIDEKKISAKIIKKLARGAPLVFLNGCISAYGIKSIADAFLKVGSKIVIGTIFKVPEDGARCLAEKFYNLIFEGRPVGEALKEARIEVQRNKEFGATWVSYIMYGDPRFRLKTPQPPDLPLIQEAKKYAQLTPFVTSYHLFMAMIGGEEGSLRDFLEDQNPDVFKSLNESKKALDIAKEEKTFRWRYSVNAEEILTLAEKIAKERRCERISEIDLLIAFIFQGGGTTGQKISNSGINFEEILGSIPDTQHLCNIIKNQTVLGPIKKEECDTSCWDIIRQSIKNALYFGWDKVRTLHLFLAMLDKKEGYLVNILKMHGGSPYMIEQLRHDTKKYLISKGNILLKKDMREIDCSENLKRILLKAIDISLLDIDKRDKITEKDLALAFFKLRRGKTW